MQGAQTAEAYRGELAVAFVRGRLQGVSGGHAEILATGRAAGLRLHRFKRNAELPRVRAALGIVRAFAPGDLLDIGSGRGTFLWPLLESLPGTRVTAIDIDPMRARDLAAVRAGGIERLAAARADVDRLPFRGGAFDVVTVLEVLEHLADPEGASIEVVRVARRAVVASVPARADDNPGHLHVLGRDRLARMFRAAGARRVTFTGVRGHTVAVAALP